ncbi:MAG: hypothetical protein ACT4OO_08295 [Nitrospiraceae bacterium]
MGHRLRATISVALLPSLIALSAIGCASLSGSGTKIHQSSKGTIVLREADDWSFEATHPVSIDAATIGAILRGVQITEPQSSASRSTAAIAKPMRVFTDAEVEFLIPQLAGALVQAKPEQIIEFRVGQPAGTKSDMTIGTLYAHKSALYITLLQYQGKTWESGSSWFGRHNSDTKAVTRGNVGLAQEMPGRVEAASETASLGHSNLRSLVVDYPLLSRAAPVPATFAKGASPRTDPMPTASASPVIISDSAPVSPAMAQETKEIDFLNQKLEELRKAKDTIDQQEGRIAGMRKDLDTMRRQLAEREAELKGLKAKKVSVKTEHRKSAEVTKPKH